MNDALFMFYKNVNIPERCRIIHKGHITIPLESVCKKNSFATFFILFELLLSRAIDQAPSQISQFCPIYGRVSIIVSTSERVRPCLKVFPFVLTFLFTIVLLLFLCQLLHFASPLQFSCARYTVWDRVHDIQYLDSGVGHIHIVLGISCCLQFMINGLLYFVFFWNDFVLAKDCFKLRTSKKNIYLNLIYFNCYNCFVFSNSVFRSDMCRLYLLRQRAY